MTGAGKQDQAHAASAMSALHVVGVDLSLTGTGVACRHGVETITSRGNKDASLIDRHHRLQQLREEVLGWCGDADLIVIEQPAYSRVQGHNHDRSGLWWLVVSALHARSRRVVEVAPTCRAKYATGKGNAGKDEVLAAVVRRYSSHDVSNNNEADALVLAAMGHDAAGDALSTVPAAHRQALAAVAWPDFGVAA